MIYITSELRVVLSVTGIKDVGFGIWASFELKDVAMELH